MNETKQFFLNHSKIDVYFKQSKDDFVVTEVALYEFSGEGEHLIVKIRKKDLSTWDMVQILSDAIGCKSRDIGYAGLKDKNAMTIQHISMHRSFEEKLKAFEHPQIKILETTYHNNKIRVGHLKGNKFFIRLKRVLDRDVVKLESVLKQIEEYGMPNYFGFQRFGIEGDNHIKGQEISEGTRNERNRKLKQMFLNAYQSYLFNMWLSKRIEISKLIEAFEPKEISEKLRIEVDTLKAIKKQKHPLKIFEGDLMEHYPYGRLFYVEELESEANKFFQRDRVPTGLLAGKKSKTAQGYPRQIEEEFDKKTISDGTRRYAWVFPTDISHNYNEEKNHFEVEFTLPKGSYATELIRELIH
jgi:tRNA pseudouridine13 synthase